MHLKKQGLTPPFVTPVKTNAKSGVGLGQLLMRLAQFNEHQTKRPTKPEDDKMEFWRQFVSEFFNARTTYKYIVWLGDPESEARNFQLFQMANDTLPRFFNIIYASSIVSVHYLLENPREYYVDARTFLLYSSKAHVEYTYENGCRVVTHGYLRVTFTEELKIMLWEFEAHHHQEFIPTSCFRDLQAIQKSGENFGAGLTVENGNTVRNSAATIALDDLPKSQINQFGLPPPVMRCFEITEVINYMAALIDFSMETGYSPLDSLARYPQGTKAKTEKNTKDSPKIMRTQSTPPPGQPGQMNDPALRNPIYNREKQNARTSAVQKQPPNGPLPPDPEKPLPRSNSPYTQPFPQAGQQAPSPSNEPDKPFSRGNYPQQPYGQTPQGAERKPNTRPHPGNPQKYMHAGTAAMGNEPDKRNPYPPQQYLQGGQGPPPNRDAIRTNTAFPQYVQSGPPLNSGDTEKTFVRNPAPYQYANSGPVIREANIRYSNQNPAQVGNNYGPPPGRENPRTNYPQYGQPGQLSSSNERIMRSNSPYYSQGQQVPPDDKARTNPGYPQNMRTVSQDFRSQQQYPTGHPNDPNNPGYGNVPEESDKFQRYPQYIPPGGQYRQKPNEMNQPYEEELQYPSPPESSPFSHDPSRPPPDAFYSQGYPPGANVGANQADNRMEKSTPIKMEGEGMGTGTSTPGQMKQMEEMNGEYKKERNYAVENNGKSESDETMQDEDNEKEGSEKDPKSEDRGKSASKKRGRKPKPPATTRKPKKKTCK